MGRSRKTRITPAMVRKWRRRLRLSEADGWDILVVVVAGEDLDNPERDEYYYGRCRADRKNRQAVIVLRDPDRWGEYDFGAPEPVDIELILVHELIHCIIPGWGERTEAKVEALSNALYETAHDARPRPRKRLSR